MGLYKVAWCCVGFVHNNKCLSKITLQCFVLKLKKFSRIILRIFSCKIKSRYAPGSILLSYSCASKDNSYFKERLSIPIIAKMLPAYIEFIDKSYIHG